MPFPKVEGRLGATESICKSSRADLWSGWLGLRHCWWSHNLGGHYMSRGWVASASVCGLLIISHSFCVVLLVLVLDACGDGSSTPILLTLMAIAYIISSRHERSKALNRTAMALARPSCCLDTEP